MIEHMTHDDIVKRLAEFGTSPADNGTVEMIVCRPAAGERQILDEGHFDSEQGLIGDNWLARGSRHTPDGSAHPGAQVAIMNSRIIAAIEPQRERWSLAGDQLFVDFDLSAENLPAGQQFQIGEVILQVSDLPHNGCQKFTERFGSAATRFVNSSEGRARRRRGINTIIVVSGVIRTGDTITKIDPADEK